jgi:hypothetical protein
VQISFLNPGFVMFKRHDEWRRDLYQLVLKNPVAAETRCVETVDPEMRIFPNPFRSSVTLSLPEGSAGIRIYDSNGRMIHRVKDLRLSEYRWDTSGLPAGRYLARIRVNGKTVTNSLFLQK